MSVPAFFSHPLRMLRWFRRPLVWITRFKIVPENPLDIVKPETKPVCFLLRTNSNSDIVVLDHVCRRNGLPAPVHKPTNLHRPRQAAYLTVTKLGILQPDRKRDSEFDRQIMTLAEKVQADPDFDIALVPVSIVWGRDPGKEDQSLFELLFSDHDAIGFLQKFFVVLVQGRHTLVNFSKPISLRSLFEDGGDERVARKLRRLMRLHFRSQRVAMLGPQFYDRSQIIESIIRTQSVQKAIGEEVQKSGSSYDRAEQRARRYATEISADRTMAVIRLLDLALRKVWTKIFEDFAIENQSKMHEIAGKYELVFVSNHRSHLDYPVIGWALYRLGYMPPHIAAGINMNFWPVGWILRRAGAFFLRRTFGGNKLYKAVFAEYVHILLAKGHSISFFPEGGRSRTGRLLRPRTGLYSVIIQSWLKNPERKLAIVPVHIAYDRVPEVKSYLREMRGDKKKKESLRQLIGASKIMESSWGKPYINFGEPLVVEEFFNRTYPAWKTERQNDEEKPAWLVNSVNELALEMMIRINSAAAVSPSALCALAVLATSTAAMAEDELVALVNKLEELLRLYPYSPLMTCPKEFDRAKLIACEHLSALQRFSHPAGDVIYLGQPESVLMSYYRNNVLHLFALPSLVASFFEHNEEMDLNDIVAGSIEVYPFLHTEFFLRWTPSELPSIVRGLIDAMISLKLLRREARGATASRPVIGSPESMQLRVLGQILGQTFQRYAISAGLLAHNIARGPMMRSEIEDQCQKMVQRMAILSGNHDPDVFDAGLFQNYVDILIKLGYIAPQEDGRLKIRDSIREISAKSVQLLSMDLRKGIERMTILGDSLSSKEK